ncbi:SRPBCC domain-containing protein [Kribbella sp. NPDC026596]|uniref:SRPBCC family protein n=1 Tax=Kribbella sp. NPDC026596 TaxID=3155122 RepID=UPI00340FBA97
MARIVFELEVDAPADRIVEALDTEAGIAGWWTADVGFPGGAGTTMTLGFPIAPMPFELRVDEAAPDRLSWTSVGEFPPHWVGTRVLWTLTPQPGGGSTLVHFSHDGWATDEGPFASSALTWGRLMDTLKGYAETGIAAPLFPKG